MYSLSNLYAEQMRRQELVEDALREQAIRDLLEKPRSFHPLYALGKTLSTAGDRLQARYGQVARRARPHVGKVSFRFN